jgi:hypothetical protein
MNKLETEMEMTNLCNSRSLQTKSMKGIDGDNVKPHFACW